MDPRAGFTTPNLLEADTDRALVAAGQRLIVLADHTKWGMVGISTIAELAEADLVVTDEGISADGRAALADASVGVVVAPYRTADGVGAGQADPA
jgi:DeoR/GlpR family transcriptional regulator of sugar metabolism